MGGGGVQLNENCARLAVRMMHVAAVQPAFNILLWILYKHLFHCRLSSHTLESSPSFNCKTSVKKPNKTLKTL